MDFLMSAMVAILITSIVLLVACGLVAGRIPRISEGFSFLGQILIFVMGSSATGLAILITIDILVPVMNSGDGFWNNLAGGTCISLVVTGFGIVVVGGFATLEAIQKLATSMRRKA